MGDLPSTDRCGPAPPTAVKSPCEYFGVTFPVQRERTSPATRLQLHHGLQALGGDPQAAGRFPTSHPSPLPASSQLKLELTFTGAGCHVADVQWQASLPSPLPFSHSPSTQHRSIPSQRASAAALALCPAPRRAAAAPAQQRLVAGCRSSPRCR